YYYYGDLLPATGSAKIGQGKSGLWGDGRIFLNVKYLIDWAFSGSYFSLLFNISFSFYGFLLLIKERIAIISVIFAVLLFSFYFILNIPNYHWYYAPFFYLLLIFSCKGIWEAFLILKNIKNDFTRTAGIFILISMVLISLSKTVSFDLKGGNDNYQKIGLWIKENTPKNASIAMVEIGTVGWYADRKIVDILGLVNKYNADHIGNREFFGWLTHYQPDYILRHQPVWPHEQSVLSLEVKKYYESVEKFKFAGFSLLKKTTQGSDLDIEKFAKNEKRTVGVLELMEKSSEIGAPYVMMEGQNLFAHAPSLMKYIIPDNSENIDVTYGLKEDAEGKHFGVCFEIIKASNGQTLMNDCINKQSKKIDFLKSKSLPLSINKGDALIFKTTCMASC
ncbi:hypothetical protein QN362_18855, partial [Actimicrobium sp. CCC2.4]|nr:hypothetical protein [Actimicrobium sp. CCC2.4]